MSMRIRRLVHATGEAGVEVSSNNLYKEKMRAKVGVWVRRYHHALTVLATHGSR